MVEENMKNKDDNAPTLRYKDVEIVYELPLWVKQIEDDELINCHLSLLIWVLENKKTITKPIHSSFSFFSSSSFSSSSSSSSSLSSTVSILSPYLSSTLYSVIMADSSNFGFSLLVWFFLGRGLVC